MYYWDGQQWLSTLSHDGRTRWNGSAWIPTGLGQAVTPYQQPTRTVRQATSWTRPLQNSVAGWYALSAIYALSLPFWMSGPMAQAVGQSIKRQEALNPSRNPPSAEVLNMMSSMTSAILWIAAAVSIAIAVVAIIGALRRWTWTYYAVLVLLGFSVISVPLNMVSAVGGSAYASAAGISMPSWTYTLALVLAIPSTALFVWMLITLVKRGPWGMKKVAPTVSQARIS